MLAVLERKIVKWFYLPIFIFNAAIATNASTLNLITSNNYTVEQHEVKTLDGYILTLYRMGSGPETETTENTKFLNPKPVVLLLHGFALTSDAWVLGHPTQNLAYLLVDAGCDVWLGNQRGNTYSRGHEFLDVNYRPYWNFSWHEIGYYDLAAKFDYILHTTGTDGLHYVGYSQGTSALLVLLSTRPVYSTKLRSIHFLAPVAYLKHMSTPLARLSSWLHELGATLAHWFGYREVLQYTEFPYYRKMCELLCSEGNPWSVLCKSFIEFIGGYGSAHTNASLLPAICATHPAGASSKQILHFLQVYRAGKFQHYDYGEAFNKKIYQQSRPPLYEINKIRNCINLYYSNNDSLAAAADVVQLSKVLSCAKLHRIKPDWNHYDFLWSHNVKEEVCDPIIKEIKHFEQFLNPT